MIDMENILSDRKKETVKKDYDLIAEQYAKDFGIYIEDLDIYEEFEKYLDKDATILDLGAGSGRTYRYFNEKGYKYIGLDFSEKMKDCAYKLHGEFPYVVDDMVNVKEHFSDNSVDAVFAVYSLFHLPEEDFKKVISDVYDILKDGGVFLFSYQMGEGEEMADEPYLDEEGKNILYMHYWNDDEIEKILSSLSFKRLFRKEKIEETDSAINSNDVKTAYILVRK